MNQLMLGVVPIVIGVALIILRSWLIKGGVDFQDRIYGLHFGGAKIIKYYNWVAIILGIALIIYGVAVLIRS